MLTSWKLDPHTVMRLKSGRRGDDVLKGGHLACSSHKPLTSSYSPVTKRLQAGQDHGFRIVYPAKYYLRAFRCTDSVNSSRFKDLRNHKLRPCVTTAFSKVCLFVVVIENVSIDLRPHYRFYAVSTVGIKTLKNDRIARREVS